MPTTTSESLTINMTQQRELKAKGKATEVARDGLYSIPLKLTF